MMSISALTRISIFGLMTNCPLILATLTSDIGPLNGISLTDSAAEAARHASASGKTFVVYDEGRTGLHALGTSAAGAVKGNL